MNTPMITNCSQMRITLDECLVNSEVCTMLFMKYKKECLQRNADLNDSKNFVFGLECRHDGLPKTKVK